MIRRRGSPRPGVTLVELMVALTVLGISTAVVTLALPRANPPVAHSPSARIAAARRQALDGGRPVTISLDVDGGMVDATVHVDGSVVTDAAIAVDRLAGRPIDGHR